MPNRMLLKPCSERAHSQVNSYSCAPFKEFRYMQKEEVRGSRNSSHRASGTEGHLCQLRLLGVGQQHRKL